MNKKTEKQMEQEKEDKVMDALEKFYEDYETREEREEILNKMSNEEIDKLIECASSIQCKIYLSKFKK